MDGHAADPRIKILDLRQNSSKSDANKSDELDKPYDGLERILTQLEGGLTQSKISFDSLRALFSAYHSRMVETDRVLNHANEREKELSQRLKDTQGEWRKAWSRVEDLEKLIETYKKSLEEKQSFQIKIVQKHEQALAVLRRQESRIHELSKLLEQTRNEIQKTVLEKQSQQNEYELSINSITTKLNQYKTEYAKVRSALMSRDSQIQELRAAIAAFTKKEKESEVQYKSICAEKESLQNQMARKVQTVEGALLKEKRLRNLAQSRIEELEGFLHQFEKNKTDLEDKQIRLVEATALHNRLEATVSHQNQELQQLRQLNESLKTSLNSERDRIRQLEKSLTETKVLPQKIVTQPEVRESDVLRNEMTKMMHQHRKERLQLEARIKSLELERSVYSETDRKQIHVSDSEVSRSVKDFADTSVKIDWERQNANEESNRLQSEIDV